MQQKSQTRQKDNQENTQSAQYRLRQQDARRNNQEHAALLKGGLNYEN